MNKEFAPYELALRLKIIGFNEPCFGCFTKEGKLSYDFSDNKGEGHYFQVCSAPTFSQAFRWLRDNHDLRAHPEKGQNPDNYYPVIFKPSSTVSHRHNPKLWFDTYEQAELACLDILLEIVENK